MESLAGRTIVITRAEAQAETLAQQLRALGATPLIHPAIAFAPPHDQAALDKALQNAATYDWLVLTSANGVRVVAERMTALGIATNTWKHVAAIGPATATALRAYGISPTLVPTEAVAEALLAAFGDVEGQSMLLPTADLAREVLADGLRKRGALVDVIVAYRTVPGPGAATLAPLLRAGSIDAVTFTSSSTVRYLLEGLQQAGMSQSEIQYLFAQVAVICIGPITMQTARDLGLPVAAAAETYSTDGMIAALATFFQTPKP